MPYFDRFDICAAHAAIEADYNLGGWVRERPSNVRRRESTACQLHRMQYRAAPGGDRLTENGQEIYDELEARYGFTTGGFDTYHARDVLGDDAARAAEQEHTR